MGRGDSHQSDVVVLENISRMDILLMVPDKMAELMDHQHTVGAPRNNVHHVRRVLIFFRLLSLLPASVLESVPKQDVEEEVCDTESKATGAYHPVKQAALMA